jgi:uncharacterized membrane protein YdbT with pleckstrin-like domain
MSVRKNTPHEERFLFKIRPKFISTMTAQVLRIIILLLLLYFFSAIIIFATVIQGTSTDLINIPFVQWTTYILILIIALIFSLIVWNILSWRSTCYILTNQRVMIKSGVLSKKNIYIHYDKMQDIIVSQGIIQRISNSGNIKIFGGRDRTSLILKDIPDPDEVENMINQKIESHESETGKIQGGKREYK